MAIFGVYLCQTNLSQEMVCKLFVDGSCPLGNFGTDFQGNSIVTIKQHIQSYVGPNKVQNFLLSHTSYLRYTRKKLTHPLYGNGGGTVKCL